MASDSVNLEDWVGRTESVSDTVGASQAVAMAATLDRDTVPAAGDALPALWHWAYFTPKAPAREVGPDGHPKRGGFLPPVALPRRMWAGGRLSFHRSLLIGDAATRFSTISDVRRKDGKSGSLVFVTVRHEIGSSAGVAVAEEQDIVYRDAPAPVEPASKPAPAALQAPVDETFARTIVPDPVLLFRYSALTFNGHRIHYDRTYATEVEGYPGLIVHGPLIATLLLEEGARQRPQARVARFEFKAVHPVFDIHQFTVCGREEAEGKLALWARDHEGRLAMTATLEFTK